MGCGLCRKVCPVTAPGNFKEKTQPKFYAAKHKSGSVLMVSTSGGAFTAISDVVLSEGGFVCGADFDEKYRVVHRITDNREGRDRMRISKYVQSDLDGVFAQIKALLPRRKVLFTGTPCQCAGLRSFVGNAAGRENLTVCDVICHSIPSPLLWEEYKKMLEEEAGGHICDVKFRSKKNGWSRENSNRGFLYKIEGEVGCRSDDRFYKLFFKWLTVTRPSCEKCRFTDIHRASDITIADCWGIEEHAPDFWDSRGVSLVLVNSKRGEELLEKMKNDMDIIERPQPEIMEVQPRLSHPGKYPANRAAFWESLRKYGLKRTMEGRY